MELSSRSRRRSSVITCLLAMVSMCIAPLSPMTMAGCAEAGSMGVNYGRIGSNLPAPIQVVKLIQQQGIRKVKLYDADPSVLSSFAGSGIDLVVAIPNEQLQSIASSERVSDQWVAARLLPHIPATRVAAIAVGNEVLSSPKPEVRLLSPSLLPAMLNIHSSLAKLRLDQHIKVSTPHSLSTLSSSFPPSMGAFNPSISTPFMKPLLRFLASTNSFIMINVYPFFAYESQPDTVSLDYALFRGSSQAVKDPHNGLSYTNLFDAQVDAFCAAMEELGYPHLPVVVTETGWPSNGDETEVGASRKNAEAYVNNLIKHITSNVGTPRRPGASIDVYIFALFNEDMKEGPRSERNYGLFYPNQQRVYKLDPASALYGSGPKQRDVENKRNPHLHPYRSRYGNGWGSGGAMSWCVANGGVSPAALQEAMDYACGVGGADCSAIQPGQPCFYPNTLVAHASFAFNSYYQYSRHKGGTCSFQGASLLTKQDPSYHGCKYPGSV